MGLDEFLKRQFVEFVLNLELALCINCIQVVHKERINTTSKTFPFLIFTHVPTLPLLTPCTLQHHGILDRSRQSLVRNLALQIDVRFEE